MNFKNNKGSIAIFVLVGLLFMSSFLIISFANVANRSKAVKEQHTIIGDIYNTSDVFLQDVYYESISIDFDIESMEIENGGLENIVVALKNEDKEDAQMNFKIENEEIAMIENVQSNENSNTIKIKGLKNGETKLIAEYEEKIATCSITVIPERITYLNIENGTIELYSNGYKQNNGELNIVAKNKYEITGTTTVNSVKINEIGTYNITINNLNIDLSGFYAGIPFDANASRIKENLFVNIYLLGTSTLKAGGDRSALHFGDGIPNVNGVVNGSTLTIQGDGELNAIGNKYSAGIGGGIYGNGNNIIINSGTIYASSKTNAAAIGAGYKSTATNIVINGGNITATSGYNNAIGTYTLDNTVLTINGGNIEALGGEYGSGALCADHIIINGGIINAKARNNNRVGIYAKDLVINDGTITAIGTKINPGIGINAVYADATEEQIAAVNVQINGGSVFSTGANPIGAGKVETFPHNSANVLLYKNELQLLGINEKIKISSIVTSDNIAYGSKDIYTDTSGKVYLYLPVGTRTITIIANEKEYSAVVTTTESGVIAQLEGI